MSSFPSLRLRRLRQNPVLRDLLSETKLGVRDLVAPLFVVPGQNIKQPIDALFGYYRYSVDLLIHEARALKSLGVKGVILFGLPAYKDPTGSSAQKPDGIVQQALLAIRENVPGLLCIADLCFCEYTSHGHCGILTDNGQDVDNDKTLNALQTQALSLVQAGAEVIAPSGMIDGMVKAIRSALDNAGFSQIPILSYAAKFCSAFYGPFREAVDSTPSFGDRKTYQLNPANSKEAMREILIDVEEGADMLLIKPALPYLDIISKTRDKVSLPIFAYHVSGEYAMIKAAAKQGLLEEGAAFYESLLAIKRAGADVIISYAAREIAAYADRN